MHYNKEIMEYLGKATSKDQSRVNLTGVYRDVDCFVATDGHRLHWINGQDKIERGYYVGGLDAEFPDWKQALPRTEALKTVTVRIDRHELLALKAMLKFLQTVPEQRSERVRNSVVTISANRGERFLNLVHASANYKLLILSDEITLPKIGIQLAYLIDAIETPIKAGADSFVLGFHGGASPLEVSTEFWGAKAMIVPCRL